MTTQRQESTGQKALSAALEASFRVLRVLMILVAAAYLLSGVFIVRQHEVAFVLNGGRFAGLGEARLRGPGIHLAWPRPLSEVVRVPVARVQTSESRAFWPAGGEALPERPGAPAPATLRPGRDGYAITADANLLHSQWALRYTIVNPERHVFRFCDAAPFLRNELERAVLLAVSRRRIDEALRTDIEALRAAVESQLRRRVEDLGLGIRVERVDALRLAPPRQVAAAFDSVIAAEQERSRLISAAGAEAARDLNEARGQAAGLEAEAQADRQRLVAEVKADADYFLKIREQYDANPGVTMRTLRQDALRRALAGVEEKYVVREPAGSRQEFRLLLGPEQAPPAAAP